MYRLCSIVDVISTAGPDGSLPFLSEVYEHAPYSSARSRVVSAMSRCNYTGATKELLTEALWDCEPKSRELACRAVGKSRDLPPARIQEMATDSFEDRNVREAALHEPRATTSCHGLCDRPVTFRCYSTSIGFCFCHSGARPFRPDVHDALGRALRE